MLRYPQARLDMRAITYGPLEQPTALVLHTTETSGSPGYRSGAVAPHFEYHARERSWRQMANPELRVGTMKGSSATGIKANEKAIQVEIVARSSAVGSGLWVGDFTDAHYDDLAEFVAWARNVGLCTNDVTPTPPGGWRYGAGSGLRLSVKDWYLFTGLTCHGAVPGQSHWDTGVLNLERISGEEYMISTERWASRLRLPADIDRMAEVGIITAKEADYWSGRSRALEDGVPRPLERNDPEWQDLRDAVAVRSPLYV